MLSAFIKLCRFDKRSVGHNIQAVSNNPYCTARRSGTCSLFILAGRHELTVRMNVFLIEEGTVLTTELIIF
jgi:hypothetical protein